SRKSFSSLSKRRFSHWRRASQNLIRPRPRAPESFYLRIASYLCPLRRHSISTMQNKWYVGGMALPGIALAGITVWCMATQNWLLAIVPALLATGLLRGAWWAWHCEAFAS